jgi:RecJ-like exonuclease
MTGPVPELESAALACARRLLAADSVLVASHIDADGLTSGAIATTALARAGVDHDVTFANQLDEPELERIAASDHQTVLFTDFGSGQLETVARHEAAGAFTPVVVDHHQPADAETEYHLNPLLVGLDGASELSGAGASYVLARALAAEGRGPATDGGSGVAAAGSDGTARDGSNRDLAALAVVGAVGDMQDGREGLSGANEAVVAEGEAAGVVRSGTDLALYGRQTRPLPKLLEYASDLRIPGISNDEAGAVAFLSELDVDLRTDGDWRRWVDLTDEERQAVVSALIRRAIESGVPASRVDSIAGTTYVLPGEPEGTELRDVSEFSTLLNATARYERADVGLAVCLGDRGPALERARTLLRNHRRNLSEGLQWVKQEGVERTEYLQWFDAGTRIRETIVGIVAGMAMGSAGLGRDRPVVAFAEKSEDALKVSARGTHALVRRGLDLSAVMDEAAGAVGGEGGGHDVAAGATIPAGERDAFLEAADRLVGEQLR